MADVYFDDMSCCGVTMFGGLSDDPLFNIRELMGDLEDRYPCGKSFILFTDFDKRGHGEKLHKFIKSKRLGTVHRSRAKHNPNSGNYIRVYTWEPDYKKVKACLANAPVKKTSVAKSLVGLSGKWW